MSRPDHHIDPIEHYFRWTKALDRGGMGLVFIGEHIESQTPVVLKVPLRKQRRAFAVEVNAAMQVDSPDVVTLYEHGTLACALTIDGHRIEQGTPYVVMEYVQGQPLEREVVAQLGSVWRVLVRLARATAALHAVGVIHRDLKPKNILARPELDALTIIDFGLSSSAEHLQVVSSGGTAATMAPEQLDPHAGLGHGPWTDLYALACMAYYWLTGEYPFCGLTHDEIWAAKLQGWTAAHAARVSPSWSVWFERALHPDPRMRWRSMAHALGALGALGEDALPVGVGAAPAHKVLWASSQTVDGPQQPSVTAPVTLSEPLVQPLMSMSPPARELEPQHIVGVGLGVFHWRKLPLVGRQQEQAELSALLRRAHARGELACALICGQAGIGKSALGQWLSRAAHLELGAVTLVLGCDEHDDWGGILTRALLRWADVHEQMSATARRQRLLARFSHVALAASHQRVLWSMQAEQVKTPSWEACLESFAALVRALAGYGTTLLRVEDPSPKRWHSLYLELARQCAQAPVVVVVTQRIISPDEPLLSEGIAQTLPLGGLNPSAQKQLLGHLLTLSPALERVLLARSDGHPLFAVRLLHDWVERRLLLPTYEGFELRADASLDAPADLMDLCLKRFLPLLAEPKLKRCLCAMATLGRTLSDEELSALAARFELSFDQLLSTLQHRQLVDAVHEGWRLSHNMLHESLLKWRDEHEDVAAAHGHCAAILRQLGHQHTQAWRRRITHELGAGQLIEGLEVAGRYLAAVQVQVASQWLEGFEQRFAHTLDEREALLWELVKLIPAQSQGQWGVVEQGVSPLRELAQRLGCPKLTRKVLHVEVDTAVQLHRFEQAQQRLTLWYAMLDEREHAQEFHSALRIEANLATAMGDIDRALACLLRAQALVPDPSWDLAWTQYQLAGAYEALGQLEDSMRQCELAMAFFVTQDELSGMASCLAQLASLDLHFERFIQAQARFEEATALYQQCGDGGQWLTQENALRAALRSGQLITIAHLERLRQIQRALEAGEGFASFIDDMLLLALVSLNQWDELPAFFERVAQQPVEPWMYDEAAYTPLFIELAMERLDEDGQSSWLKPLRAWQERLSQAAQQDSSC